MYVEGDLGWKVDCFIGAVGAGALFYGLYLMYSIIPKYRLMKQQHEGGQTRYGVFLLDDLLISHNWSDTTVIPRTFFKGLDGSAVQYKFLGEAKTVDLPRQIISNDQDALALAIRSWASAPSVQPDV